MIGELMYAKCSRKDGHETYLDRYMRTTNTDAKVLEFTVGITRGDEIFLFTSHSDAIRAMQAAGWRIGSESIGGDVCAACVAKEQGDE